MIQRVDVVLAARSQLGVRWQHQARLKDVAVDCRGLLIVTAEIAGLDPDVSSEFDGYGRQPDPAMLRRAVNRYLDPASKPGLGDIYMMFFEEEPQHFAIISRENPIYIIHSLASKHRGGGRVVEHRLDDSWRSRIVSAHRFRGVA